MEGAECDFELVLGELLEELERGMQAVVQWEVVWRWEGGDQVIDVSV